MSYRRTPQPGVKDHKDLSRYTDDELRAIQRAMTELEESLTTVQSDILALQSADTLLDGRLDIIEALHTREAAFEIVATGPRSLVAAESGMRFANTGATALVRFNLPAAAAGLWFEFAVLDADGVRVVADTGDVIQVDGTTSASAGRIDATVVGTSVILRALNTARWVADAGNNRAGWTVT